jgi:hypothetical protein
VIHGELTLRRLFRANDGAVKLGDLAQLLGDVEAL